MLIKRLTQISFFWVSQISNLITTGGSNFFFKLLMSGCNIKNTKSLFERTKWDSNAEFKARDKDEEEEENQGRRKGHHHPEGIYCSPTEPKWNKRHLLLLYEQLSYNEFGATSQKSIELQNLSRNQTAIVETKVYSETVTYPDSDDSWLSGSGQTSESLLGPYPKPPKISLDCSHTFLWLIKRKKGLCLEAKLPPTFVSSTRLDHKDPLQENFLELNYANPYLFGKQHRNRFKIGTKVFVLKGYFSGLHGVVVGHKQGFNLFDESKDPILKILLVSKSGEYEIQNISQWIVKLIDLHKILPFGILLLPSTNSTPNKFVNSDFFLERESKRAKWN